MSHKKDGHWSYYLNKQKDYAQNPIAKSHGDDSLEGPRLDPNLP